MFMTTVIAILKTYKNDVWSQTSTWEAKMLTEEKEAEESIKQIQVFRLLLKFLVFTSGKE